MATSKTTHKRLGWIMYEVHIAGQFVEGKFLGVSGEQNGINRTTVISTWVRSESESQ